MLTALVLICSFVVTPNVQNCNRNNAVSVVEVPEKFLLPAQCFMRGQAYIAETTIGQTIGPGEAVKVLCIRSRLGTVG